MSQRIVPRIDIWTTALDTPHVDAAELAAAVEEAALAGPQDFRTRLLIRDSVAALSHVWGNEVVQRWLSASPARAAIAVIRAEDLGEPGFPSLLERVMETTKRETILQFLRELGSQVHKPSRIVIGGSSALIVSLGLIRRTEDIDVVNELPIEIRSKHDMLKNLTTRFGLQLTHFQSRYLPSGWEARVRSLGGFGELEVVLVDELDVLVSKLTSKRDKDRDDLRAMARKIEKVALAHRLLTAGSALLAEPDLRANATKNWYIVYGEPLPA